MLVDPASFETLCAAIEGLGWIRRHAPMPVPRAADLAFDHSAHFIHEQWPCDLDLHFSFPGFFADAVGGVRRALGRPHRGRRGFGARQHA